MLSELGFQELEFADLTPHLATHYGRILDGLLANEQDLTKQCGGRPRATRQDRPAALGGRRGARLLAVGNPALQENLIGTADLARP